MPCLLVLCFSVFMLRQSSLVPRPFPPPVFDRLQYANTEGEGVGLKPGTGNEEMRNEEMGK